MNYVTDKFYLPDSRDAFVSKKCIHKSRMWHIIVTCPFISSLLYSVSWHHPTYQYSNTHAGTLDLKIEHMGVFAFCHLHCYALCTTKWFY